MSNDSRADFEKAQQAEYEMEMANSRAMRQNVWDAEGHDFWEVE